MGRNKIRVRQYLNGKFIKEYDSITDAAKAVNGQACHISECMRGVRRRHTHKGYEWRK